MPVKIDARGGAEESRHLPAVHLHTSPAALCYQVTPRASPPPQLLCLGSCGVAWIALKSIDVSTFGYRMAWFLVWKPPLLSLIPREAPSAEFRSKPTQDDLELPVQLDVSIRYRGYNKHPSSLRARPRSRNVCPGILPRLFRSLATYIGQLNDKAGNKLHFPRAQVSFWIRHLRFIIAAPGRCRIYKPMSTLGCVGVPTTSTWMRRKLAFEAANSISVLELSHEDNQD
ncbi:hypothetical protein B0J13DRAFT_610319 [Dactylonectria estremocensis]|uniref:Uncharacterized protein n=1 Tax=Dactylonectria estremocensis TaxID=1079267 RepID=A0A9P9E9U2_9HYPO|nr:hypothetical protein B0J13DRAFT_610319 [Dactylonectria estremocensis]